MPRRRSPEPPRRLEPAANDPEAADLCGSKALGEIMDNEPETSVRSRAAMNSGRRRGIWPQWLMAPGNGVSGAKGDAVCPPPP